MRNISLILLLLALPQLLAAQYHLNELGLNGGLGVQVPIGRHQLTPGPAYNLDFWFSHYRCGKRDGFHCMAGLRGAHFFEQSSNVPNFFSQTAPTSAAYNFLYAELGFFYKVRPHKHHRDKELAFLMGPKGLFRLMGLAQPEGGAYQNFDNGGYRSAGIASPGLHLGLWMRFPIPNSRDKRSWFLYPGVDYYFLNLASTGAGLNFTAFHIYLNAGIQLWSNK